jgi:ketosteroid isomerase-like protein
MESWKQAILKKDAAALDRLLHPDLTYSHSDARTESKADILKALPNTQSIKIGESSVRVYGNTALVKGPMDFVNITNGAPATINLSVLQVWLKGPKGWQLVARQSTRLP